jgi:hypothetical protein
MRRSPAEVYLSIQLNPIQVYPLQFNQVHVSRMRGSGFLGFTEVLYRAHFEITN